jgi:hypothetical protein
MDSPKACNAPVVLEGEETKEIALYALSTDRVFEITKGTKVSAEITLEYKMNGR